MQRTPYQRTALHDPRAVCRFPISDHHHWLRVLPSFGLFWRSRRHSHGGQAHRFHRQLHRPVKPHPFSRQIAPGTLRLVGICAIDAERKLEHDCRIALAHSALSLDARRSARRMKTGLDPYYELWEGISRRITGTLNATKTVKLSAAESREEVRLDAESQTAYNIYTGRIRIAHRFFAPFDSSTVSPSCPKILAIPSPPQGPPPRQNPDPRCRDVLRRVATPPNRHQRK